MISEWQIRVMSLPRLVVTSTSQALQRDEIGQEIESAVDAADRVMVLLAPAVNGLFSVTLDLASMAIAHPDDQVAECLIDMVDRIDQAIRQLRDDLLAEPSALPVLASEPCCPGMQMLVDRLPSEPA